MPDICTLKSQKMGSEWRVCMHFGIMYEQILTFSVFKQGIINGRFP